MATIPEPKDIFVGELAQNGDWIVASIDTSMAWPVKAEKFKYRGKEVCVLPVMRDMFPSIAIKGPQGMSRENCGRLHLGAMSALGQKRTFRSVRAMSALPPKADMCSAKQMSAKAKADISKLS